MDHRETNYSYLVFVMTLSVFALGLLAVNSLAKLEPQTQTILDYADNAVCLLFFVDFLVQLYRAENKLKYFVTWGWLDLISCIPMIDAFRWGRAARVIRILRVLRGIRSAKILLSVILQKRTESAFQAVALISIILVVISSVAILQFEQGEKANILNAEDALWWAIATITTVGYGDRYPVTTEGRMIAALLMTAGVGLFGTFSGFVAAWFLAPAEKQNESEVEELKAQIQELKDLIEQRLKTD